MNISIEKTGQVAVISVKLEKADYQDAVKKEIKNISQKAQLPGFRPGKVPASVIQKQFGTQVKADAVNQVLDTKLTEYIRENKLNVLGSPLASEKQQPQDLDTQDDFEFVFDVALAPEFEISLSADDKLDFYNIEVSDEMVDNQVKNYAQQAGAPEAVETYEERDILRGALGELDEAGNLKEGGIQIERASVMPAYFRSEPQKELFAAAKVGDVITFNPYDAHGDNEFAALIKVSKEEAENHKTNFTFQVEEISRFVPAKLDTELFDRIFEAGTIKTEDEFRAKIKSQIAEQLENDSDYKLLVDLRKYAEEKVGALEMPKDVLKRFLEQQNADKGEKFVEEHFEKSIEELKWQLIKDKLAAAFEVKVNDADVKAQALKSARFQFMQYGMHNVPAEYLENFASEMMKQREQVENFVARCIDENIVKAVKKVVTLNAKSVSLEDFQKFFEEAK